MAPHVSNALKNSKPGKVVRTAHTPPTGSTIPIKRPKGATGNVKGTHKGSTAGFKRR